MNALSCTMPYRRLISMEETMVRQAPTDDGWICPTCQNHQGDLNCKIGVLICWVGANMSGCIHYLKERRVVKP